MAGEGKRGIGWVSPAHGAGQKTIRADMGDIAGSQSGWYLDGYLEGERIQRRVSIVKSPFLIGRRPDLDFAFPCKKVSSLHAEIRVERGQLWIQDMGSSNGTFVNRRRIERPTPLNDGDLLHLATNEFVVGRSPAATGDDPDTEDQTLYDPVDVATLPRQSVEGVTELRELLATRTVDPVFQPIVPPGSDATRYFELLGRGAHPKLSSAPSDLFRIAAEVGAEAQLSRLFQIVGFALAHTLPEPLTLFVNVHPRELHGEDAVRLLDMLARQRALHPDMEIVVEVHESSVLPCAKMRELYRRLSEMGCKLAYDDFGAGQARLLELVEVPCDFLKFDMSLIRDIDRAPHGRQKLVQLLVQIAHDLGIRCVAEGVERAGEWEACRQLGFGYAQGYHFGRPAPAIHWVRQDSRQTTRIEKLRSA